MNFRSDDMGKLLLRLAVGGLMLFHGLSKLAQGIGWLIGMVGFLGYGVFLGEVVAPLLIIVGYRTRLAALVVAFDMVMAVLLVLRQSVFALKEMGGGWAIELEAFYFLGSIALFFMGAGKYRISKGEGRWE